MLSLFKRRGILSAELHASMQDWKGGGGFSVNADVQLDAEDRRGCERVLRYCARPPIASDQLTQLESGQIRSDIKYLSRCLKAKRS